MSATADPAIPGLQPLHAISAGEREEMFALLTQHFEGVSREQFDSDLNEKNWVIQLRRDGRLLGFSSLLVCDAEFEGRPITAIYSGDTIVTPEAWSSPALARTWIAAVNSLRSACAGQTCYWLLLTSGFRTYRFLPLFWREFHPRPGVPMPADARRLLECLARARYGPWFDAADGIVRFPHPQRLRGPLAVIPSGRARHTDVAFFLARNPGHLAGDELACIVEISEGNLTAAGRRMVAPGKR